MFTFFGVLIVSIFACMIANYLCLRIKNFNFALTSIISTDEAIQNSVLFLR